MSSQEDPVEELLAAILDALYPNTATTAEMLPVLRIPQMETYFGAYAILLMNLADRIPFDDLSTRLEWLAEHHDDARSDAAFDHFYQGLIRRAWDQVEVPALRSALAKFLVTTAQSRFWIHARTSNDARPWINAEPRRRRELAISVAEMTDNASSYKLLMLGLIMSLDIEWLLDEIPLMPHAAGAETKRPADSDVLRRHVLLRAST